MYGAGDRLQGGAIQQSSATTLSSYSFTRGVGRIGIGLPACPRSRFTHSTRLSAQQIATNRVLQFGNREQPRLLNSQWTTADICAYMEYIVRVIRAEAYDTSVIEASMDEESISCTSRPCSGRLWWLPTTLLDWDVATILDALDELFPLQAEHRHLTVGV